MQSGCLKLLKLGYFCPPVNEGPVIYIVPLLAVFAGLGLGYGLPRIKGQFIGLFLSFSGAFLLALTFFELLPEVYEHIPARTGSLWILSGLLLQILLEFFSKGIEHGHRIPTAASPNLLISLGWSLCLHSLLEGFPLVTGEHILWGVAIHKVPVALILSYTLLKSELSPIWRYGLLLLFTISTPLGTYLAQSQQWFQRFQWELIGVSSGIFLHVSTVILFESSKGHQFNLKKIATIAIGIAVAYFL
jgi:hypothetical protein